MYLKPLKKLHLLGCFRTGQVLRRGENKVEVLEARFRYLNFFAFHQRQLYF